MKKLSILLLVLLITGLGVKAQTSIIIKGSIIDNATPNRKVFVEYVNAPSACTFKDSVLTDSLGNFMYSTTIGVGCYGGFIKTSILDCENRDFTLAARKYFKISSSTPNPDTIVAKLSYCDICRLNPKFTYTDSGLTVKFINLSGPADGADEYEWSFGEKNVSSVLKDPVYTYGSPGTYFVYVRETDTSVYCSDTASLYITVPSPCYNFNANFTDSLSCRTTHFTNSSSSNANNFLWTFGDGSSLSTKNPTHTYTASGSYSVCLIARDTIKGCVDTLCKTISLNNTINGIIYRDSNNVADSGWVYLIQMTIDSITNDTTLTAIDSTIFFNGGVYSFSNMPNGDYLIKAALAPNSAFYTNRMPTYYEQAVLWSSASSISTNGCNLVDITLATGNNPGGSGFIGGSVIQGANKVGDPLDKILVLLFNTNNDPVAFSYTNINGEYKFNNLAFGTYKVIVDLLGKPSEEYTVTLDASNQNDSNGNFDVNKDKVIIHPSSIGINPITHTPLKLYPNPANSFVDVLFDEVQAGDISVQIMDISGKILGAYKATSEQGNNNLRINIESLPCGVYIVQLKANTGVYVGRLSVNK